MILQMILETFVSLLEMEQVVLDNIVRRRRERLEAQTADVMTALSACIKSGMTIEQAFDEIETQVERVAQGAFDGRIDLGGKVLGLIFTKASTRTRTSFEIAEKRLSADSINFSAASSSTAPSSGTNDSSNASSPATSSTTTSIGLTNPSARTRRRPTTNHPRLHPRPPPPLVTVLERLLGRWPLAIYVLVLLLLLNGQDSFRLLNLHSITRAAWYPVRHE